MRRQAATPRGLFRRLADLELSQVSDPRQAKKVVWPLPTVLTALLVSLLTKARSLRAVEQRTAQLTPEARTDLGIPQRLPDNTCGALLPRLPRAGLGACLRRLVLQEHQRGNLRPARAAGGTVAIDGKNVGTLHFGDLCRVLGLDAATATADQVRPRLSEKFPEAQLCVPTEGEPYALLRVHTVTLTSAPAAVCVYQRAIPGHTNEVGALPGLLRALHSAYGRTHLFRRVTTDAGNTSLATAGQTCASGWAYFAQLKSEHGSLYAEAERVLAGRRRARAVERYSDAQHGQVVTYSIWQYDLTDAGWLDWTHARQLFRVERVVDRPDGSRVSVGNRYYVTSDTADQLGPKHALECSREHWRCEEETHWTADVEFQEDRRRLAWSRHPLGLLVVSLLRRIALCVLAVIRQLSRVSYSEETPSWHQVTEHFLLLLCEPLLETEAFDLV